jgi:hypothetical protein
MPHTNKFFRDRKLEVNARQQDRKNCASVINSVNASEGNKMRVKNFLSAEENNM